MIVRSNSTGFIFTLSQKKKKEQEMQFWMGRLCKQGKFACMTHVDITNIVLGGAVLLIFSFAAHRSILQQT